MNSKRNVLIVDDDGRAREALRQLLSAHPEIDIVGEAADVATAAELFRQLRPDLIFLDVQMPKRDGFSLLPELQPPPDIVFITAYDTFAVKAFEVNAVDFLVKPIHPERLALTLARVSDSSSREVGPLTEHGPVFLRSDRELRVVAAKQITHIEAGQNYPTVHLAAQKPMLVRRTMKEWSRVLPAGVFCRLGRSIILNLSAIREIVKLPNHHAKVSFQASSEEVELGMFASRRLRKIMRDFPKKIAQKT